MRQVNRDELRDRLASALRKISASQYKDLQHHEPARRLRARLRIGDVMVEAVRHYEILTDAPPPPPFRYPDLGDAPDAPMIEDYGKEG